MNFDFWRTYRPVVADTSRWLSAWKPAGSKADTLFATLSIPPFSISGLPWLGASFITTEFPVNLGVDVSILMPISLEISFLLAIRYGGLRFKLTQNQGETLHYPLYSQQSIPNGQFTIEVWTLQGQTKTELLTPKTLSISTTIDPSCDCSINPYTTLLLEHCAIFQPWDAYAGVPLPYNFNTCLSALIP
jgi:hypothetical protein